MSGECDQCGEHCIDCICNPEKNSLPKERLKIAILSLNKGFNILSELGYEIPDKFFLRKKD